MAAIGLVVLVAYRKGAPDKPLARVIPVSESEATRKKAINCGLYDRVLLATVFLDSAPPGKDALSSATPLAAKEG